jgi:hypothetical protein
VTPPSGYTGDALVIAGADLSLEDGSTTVTFPSGNLGTLTTTTPTQLVVKVPDQAGSGVLTVATVGGKATFSGFTYLGPGSPRNNTLANTLGFEARPLEMTITEAGTVISGAADPIQAGEALVLRAATGAASPVFTETAEIAAPSDLMAYPHVFALGNDILTLSDSMMTEWTASSGPPSPKNMWVKNGAVGIFTAMGDPMWETLVAAQLDASTMAVAMLIAAGADPLCPLPPGDTGGWCAVARNVRVVDGTPSVEMAYPIMRRSPQTSNLVTPSMAVSADGSWATVVAPDGHAVGFTPPGSGASLNMPIPAVAAVPCPGIHNASVVAGLDGSIVYVDATGAPTTLMGPGPAVAQMVAAPGNVVAITYPNIPEITLVTIGQVGSGVTAAVTSMPVPFVPTSIASNSSGTAIIWNTSSTSVSEVSLTRQLVEWTTDIPFVGAGGAAFDGGVLLNFVSPVPYVVGLELNNLTTPALYTSTPEFAAHLAGNNKRHVLWAWGTSAAAGSTASAATSLTVSFGATPSITPTSGTGSTFPPAGTTTTILAAVPADDADYFLVDTADTGAVALTDVTAAHSFQVGAPAPVVIGVPDPTRSVIYVLLGSKIVAVNTQTFTSAGQVDLQVALGETGITGQTMNVTRDGATLLVSLASTCTAPCTPVGSEIALLSLPALTVSATVPTAIDGAALSPDARFLYFVLPNVVTGQSSLARLDLNDRALIPLFDLPAAGPVLQYAGESSPLTQYSLLFSLDGAHLFVNDQLSGEILHVQ